MSTSAKNFFSPEQQEDILRAVQMAELDTSGEIRVHIENQCPGDVRERAAYLFKKLDMTNTEQHNGVLFYLSVDHRKFAVLGDSGINAVVPENFWDGIKMIMLNQFREGRFTEGLTEAISKAGTQLKEHFPHKANDVNELPDEVSFGEN
jgi:uncharacterized membrane protein